MAEKIGWELFRDEYKAALEKGDDVGTAIADSYDKAVRTAVPPFVGTQTGSGSGTTPGLVVTAPLKKLMAGLLNQCLKNPLPVPPFSVALDLALKIYWTGAVTSNLCVVTVPGVTAAFIDAEGIKNKSVDDFLDQLIKSMKNHLKQVQGVGVPLGTVPTFWTGYKIPDKGV